MRPARDTKPTTTTVDPGTLPQTEAKPAVDSADFDARVNDVCKRNVRAQVASVAANPFVRDAWKRGQALSVHGWIYSVQDGLLRDLEASVSDEPLGASSRARSAPPQRTTLTHLFGSRSL